MQSKSKKNKTYNHGEKTMGMTMTQKILAAHAGLDKVKADQLIQVKLDLVMSSDATFPISLFEFRKYGFQKVFDPRKMVLVMDHFTPCKDIKSAENCRLCREFAKEQGLGDNFFEIGRMGIEHALLPEQGYIAPGEVIIGGDSHTCTYGALGAFSTGMGSTDVCMGMVTGETWLKVPKAIRIVLKGSLKGSASGKDVVLKILSILGVSGALYRSMEYTGSGVQSLSMDDRFTIANMSIECGAKNGIFEVDDTAREYLAGRISREFTEYIPDPDAEYERTLEIDLADIEPMVAKPSLPGNAVPVSCLEDKVKVDEVFIGSCTNGRLSDLEKAAEVLRGKKVSKDVRVLVVPATQQIYREAIERGYIFDFLDAGCAVSTPNCAACGGGHMGLVGKNEVVLSTSNRNFVGRMGHIDSKIYLCSPATAAASALTGYITAKDLL